MSNSGMMHQSNAIISEFIETDPLDGNSLQAAFDLWENSATE